MCNLYSHRAPRHQMEQVVRNLGFDFATTPLTDNLPEYPRIYPDQDAPVLRNGDGEGVAVLDQMRWGFPPIPGQSKPITNIRNLKSRWWRDVNREFLLEPKYRCLVPWTSFAEPVRDPNWFTVDDHQIAFFAGIWRPWSGERLAEQPGKKRRGRQERDWNLYSFLTTEANDIVKPIHEKAMPVILTDPGECREWLKGGEESLRLQRPYEATGMSVK